MAINKNKVDAWLAAEGLTGDFAKTASEVVLAFEAFRKLGVGTETAAQLTRAVLEVMKRDGS
jgi:hypothetical protein